MSDIFGKRYIRGICEEFIQRMDAQDAVVMPLESEWGTTDPRCIDYYSRSNFNHFFVRKNAKGENTLIYSAVFDPEVAKNEINRMIAEAGVEMRYMVGTMIEIPRACLTADEIAKEAEFFSFGTNDLTQMTLGFSRDDTGKLLEYYVDKGIYDEDPFKTLDVNGVGKLIEMSVKLGKQARPNIKLGICGEHGGDPKTIDFCHKVGLSYVSCSPFRVPIARLAAAQAAIRNK